MTRKDFILQILRDKHRVTVKELCKELQVSHITIRRDLKQLEEENLLSRIRGGASLPFGYESKRIGSKKKLHLNEKRRIAKKLKNFINNDSTLFTNGGSTTATCIEEIEATHIQIFTNNATIISVQHSNKVTIQYLGGMLDNYSKSFFGDIALNTLDNIKADLTILGANAVHIKEGISSFFFHEAAINRKMIENTIGKIILVVDHSKMNIVSNYKICNLDDIDIIITGKECSEEFRKQVEEIGIQIILT